MAEQRIEITSGDILTDDQLRCHGRIYAGPGAGKTYFLVKNVQNIVSSCFPRGNSLQKVLCITYTNAGVSEISNRLDKFASGCSVSTIHSFIIDNIIRPFQYDLRRLMRDDFDIDVSPNGTISSQIEGLGILHGIDKKQIFKFIQDDLGLAEEIPEKKYSKKKLGDVEIDNEKYLPNFTFKNNDPFKHPDEMEYSFAKSLKKYTWSIVRKLTHDEILYFGLRIVQTNPIALLSVRTKFPYVFVDEFQDTSPIQTKLLELIGEKISKVFVVGDIAQSIFSFQGAKVSDFTSFCIKGDTPIIDYEISGNRRSTSNIVNFCNLLRSDDALKQKSIRQYESETEKVAEESKSIHLLVGRSSNVMSKIASLHHGGAPILVRTWASAFAFATGVDEEQSDLLRKIYNSYYASSIDIRSEIVEQNNVLWVRAFRCMIQLYEAYQKSSFYDVIKALSSFVEIKPSTFTPKTIYLFLSLINEAFSSFSEEDAMVSIVDKFNGLIKTQKYVALLGEDILGPDFSIKVFDDSAKDGDIKNISGLKLSTTKVLFNEIFSNDSTYLTVHQAKGLEWDNVVVSVLPTKNDKIKMIDFLKNPHVLGEGEADEFGRIYYVACSRAKNDLFIHVDQDCFTLISTILKNSNIPFDIVS